MATSNHKFIIESESRLTGIQQAQAAMDQFVNRTNSAVTQMTGSLDRVVTAWAKVAGAIYSLSKAWDLMNLAAKAKQEEQAAANLAASYGTSIDRIIADLKRASAGTIDTMTLIRNAGTAMMMGINPEQVSKLMDIARATARQTGQEVSKAFSDISLAVGRQSKMILDNLGIIVSVEKANRDYASSLNKTASELTDAEKKQAFLNATVQAGEELMARMGKVTKSTSEMFQSFSAMVQNLKVWIGDALTSLAKWVTIVFTATGEGINKWVQWIAEGVEKVARLMSKLPGGDLLGFGALSDAALAVAENSRMAADEADRFIRELINLSDGATVSVGRFNSAIEETGEVAPKALEGVYDWFVKDSQAAADLELKLISLKEAAERFAYDVHWGVVEDAMQEIDQFAPVFPVFASQIEDAMQEIDQMPGFPSDQWQQKSYEEIEHFLDRMQDLFADTFKQISRDGIGSLTDIFDSVLDLVSGSFSEQLAQSLRKNIIEPLSTGGTANWSGLSNIISSPLGQVGAASWGYNTFGGMLGLPQGGYSNIGSLAGAALGSFFGPAGIVGGSILGGIGGGLLNDNGSNLQWGLGTTAYSGASSEVNTAFGGLGYWDKNEHVDAGAMKQYLQAISDVTYQIAMDMTESQIKDITDQIAGWSSDGSLKTNEEKLTGKALDYLRQITGGLDTELANIINSWTGSFDDLYAFLVQREQVIAGVQQAVDSILNPVTGTDAVNAYWDALAQSLQDVQYEGQLLTDIEDARSKQLRDLAAAEREAARAEQERTMAVLQSLRDLQISLMAPGEASSAQWSRIAMRYGFRDIVGTPTAEQAQYMLNQIAGADTQMLLANLATLGVDPAQFQQDVQWLQQLADSVEDLGTASSSASYATSGLASSYSDLVRMAEQAASQWGGLGTSVGSTINQMMFGPANQAPASSRLASMRSMIGGMGFDSYEAANDYYQALTQYLSLAQEAYQRPSVAYQDQFSWVLDQLRAVQQYAQNQQAEAMQLARSDNQYLSQIANNTANPTVVVVSSTGGVGGSGASSMTADQVIELLLSGRGRAAVIQAVNYG